MKNLYRLDEFRRNDAFILAAYGNTGDDTCGAFFVPFGKVKLHCIASCGAGWDHVSVSLPDRCPTWEEMSFVKDLFFEPDETAMQLHVPHSDHVNYHPNCLHLWRPQRTRIPLPSMILVGPKQ
jgi:hypothetical protein